MMAGQIGRFFIQFGSQVVLARLLDPTDFGLLAMVAPVLAFVQVFNDLGLANATIQRAEITRQDTSSLFWINMAASAALCALLILAAPAVGRFYDEPRVVPITTTLAFVLLLGGLSSQQMALLGRAMRFRQLAVIDIAAMALSTASGILGAVCGMGYWSLVLMPFAVMVTTVVLSWAYTGWLPDWPRRNANVGSMMRFGGHLTGASFLNFLSRNMDNILIGRVYGSAVLGLYDRAYKLMLLPLAQVASPVSRVSIPLLSRLQDDPPRYRNAFMQMLHAIHLLAVPAMVTAVALPEQVILTLFGEKWVDVGPIFFWLAIAGLPSFMASASGWLFTSQGRGAGLFQWECISSALLVASFFLGLPYGAVGVARAYAAACVLIRGPLLWWIVTRRGPVKFTDMVRLLYPFLFAGLCIFAALYACKRYYDLHGIAGLMVGATVSYLITFVALAILPEGRQILRNVLRLKSLLRRQA